MLHCLKQILFLDFSRGYFPWNIYDYLAASLLRTHRLASVRNHSGGPCFWSPFEGAFSGRLDDVAATLLRIVRPSSLNRALSF